MNQLYIVSSKFKSYMIHEFSLFQLQILFIFNLNFKGNKNSYLLFLLPFFYRKL